MKTTKVRFTMQNLDGSPSVFKRFLLKPLTVSALSGAGVVLDNEYVFTTDNMGQCVLDIWPSSVPYQCFYGTNTSDELNNFLFIVPESDTIQEIQDLIVVPSADNYSLVSRLEALCTKAESLISTTSGKNL